MNCLHGYEAPLGLLVGGVIGSWAVLGGWVIYLRHRCRVWTELADNYRRVAEHNSRSSKFWYAMYLRMGGDPKYIPVNSTRFLS